MNWFDIIQFVSIIIFGAIQVYEVFVVRRIHNNQKDFKKEGQKDKWLS